VSACVSSLIPSAIGQPGRLPAMAAMYPQGLLKAFAAVADPRKKRGVRHRFVSILAVSACAVLAGARSFTSIAEWAHDLTPAGRAKLGIGRVAPSESTIRRTLQKLDPDVLGQALSAWLTTCSMARADRQSSPWTARPPAAPAATMAARCTCSLLWTSKPALSWDRPRWTQRPMRSTLLPRCWIAWTSPARSSPPTHFTPTVPTPAT